MANRSCRRQAPCGQAPTPPPLPLPQPEPLLLSSEPNMRRWPHPVTSTALLPQPDPMLHYIRCALTYQNELLGEIKTLLEELLAAQGEE